MEIVVTLVAEITCLNKTETERMHKNIFVFWNVQCSFPSAEVEPQPVLLTPAI